MNSIDINNLDESKGFNLFHAKYISALSSAGDINADGIDDIAIGLSSNKNQAGEVFIIYGSNTQRSTPLNDASINKHDGFKLTGRRGRNENTLFPGEYFGESVSSAGDVNSDGIDDLVIGAPYANITTNPTWNTPSTMGAAYIYYGNKNGGVTRSFTFNGHQIGGEFGIRVSSAGDINGDGKDEIIIGHRNANVDGMQSAGQIEIEPLGITLSGDYRLQSLGASVGSAGDFNGDGLDDIVTASGKICILFGNTNHPKEINCASLNGSNGLQIFHGFNRAVNVARTNARTAGDLNGDGLDDLVIGVPYAGPSGITNAGKVYVIWGKKENPSTIIDLSTLDYEQGFSIDGAFSNDLLGIYVNHAGDVNSDGIDDLIIHSSTNSYIIFGSKSRFNNNINLASLDDASGLMIRATGSGRGVSSGSGSGDFNGDGKDDLLLRSNQGASILFNLKTENYSPTGLAISTYSLNENIPQGTSIAILSSIDPDPSYTHTYSLVSGTGDTDNKAFTVNDNILRINTSPDYESQESYSIRLQTKDSIGLTFEREFILSVNDLNESPTDVTFSATTFDENISGGSAVATLSTKDLDAGDTHTYSLITGTGDNDNSVFTIHGNQIKINLSPDYETQDSYSVRIQTVDSGGLTFAKSFTLDVNDLIETPISTPSPAPTPTPAATPERTPEPEPKDYNMPNTKKSIKGTNKDDNLKGTKKNDLVTGKKGNDKLNGSSGSDVLKGHDGKDILKGAKGNDYLDGSNGKDLLIGGKGADVFQISKKTDLVQDFSIKQGDRIGLSPKGKYEVIDDTNGVLIKASFKEKLLLEGISYDKVIAAGVGLFVQPI